MRNLLRKWGWTRKTLVRRHVRRANRWKIAWFRRKIRRLIKEKRDQGYVIGVQDETIVTADARPHRMYTKKTGAPISVTGSYSKTIVFGFITTDNSGFFERYERFTKVEFTDFLWKVHQKFGKVLIIADRAPQHKARIVGEALKEMKGDVELAFLPPGCPHLSAIEEVWWQMKH